MRRLARLAPLPLLAMLMAAPVGAWTPTTYRYVTENSARMMPKSLRAILYTHRADLFAGATRPGSDEGRQEHHVSPDGRGLRMRVIQQVYKVRGLLEARAPFDEVAREMGVLAHFVADANNPLQVSDDDPREGEYVLDYSRYVEENLGKFRLVFSGYRHPKLQAGDVEGFVDLILDRSRRHYPRIGQDYIRNGRLVSSSVFDEFSFAFGIGALATSNSVGDTARLWLWIWEGAGGDVMGLPYADPARRAANRLEPRGGGE